MTRFHRASAADHRRPARESSMVLVVFAGSCGSFGLLFARPWYRPTRVLRDSDMEMCSAPWERFDLQPATKQGQALAHALQPIAGTDLEQRRVGLVRRKPTPIIMDVKRCLAVTKCQRDRYATGLRVFLDIRETFLYN